MDKLLCMVLAGGVSFGWVIFCGISGAAFSGSPPDDLERDAVLFEEAGGVDAHLGRKSEPEAGSARAEFGEPCEAQFLITSCREAGDRQPDGDRFRFATLGLAPLDSMEGKTDYMEPQWYLPGWSMPGKKDEEKGKEALVPRPVIPEPASLLLLGVVFLALAAFGRKWRKRS